MAIQAILFDIMGTVVTEPFEADIPRFLGVSLEELIRVKHPTAWVDFERGLADTVDWYLSHPDWVRSVLDGSYRLQRLGEGK